MTIQKWLTKNQTGIITGAIIALVIPLEINLFLKLVLGGLIGGYINSLQNGQTRKNLGIGPLIVPLIWAGTAIVGTIGAILTFSKEKPPTFSEQLAALPPWIWILIVLFGLLLIKALRKKPRTIILQQ